MASTAETLDTDPRVLRSRAKILDAATELMIEHGPRAVTVDAVSERSGVAKSTLYRHFNSRAHLVATVVRTHAPEPSSHDGESFEDHLRAAMTELAQAFSDPTWARLLPAVLSLRVSIPEVAEFLDRDDERKIGALRSLLAVGVAEGRFGDELTPENALAMFGGPLMMATLHGDETDLDALAERVVNTFLAAHPPATSHRK